ncbi:MAG: hypothetical protein KKI09_04665 [Spirochaetes bacterium]|nr:hypothetical protein [Spirochaetota bacterium]MBU0954703.1 hypothetical protein [Spirochaetota bacterium]
MPAEDKLDQLWRLSQSDIEICVEPERLCRDLHGRMRHLHWAVLFRNTSETLAIVLVCLVFIPIIFNTPFILARIGAGLIIAACLCILASLWRRSLRPTMPDLTASNSHFLRQSAADLRSQINLLKKVWLWYLLPLECGVLLFLLAWPLRTRADLITLLVNIVINLIISVVVLVLNYQVLRFRLQPLLHEVEAQLVEYSDA